jgi:glycosyltransferase involved in cell wall biosynthesis
MQMRALSELFDETTVVVPCLPAGSPGAGTTPLVGNRLRIVPMSYPAGRGWRRKAAFPVWLLRNLPIVIRECLRADAIHAPIPGDVGTLAMVTALVLRKPLFVRHCGNWLAPSTAAERAWKWLMERFAGGRNVMLATGGGDHPPSASNSELRWIFATSLTREQLVAGPRIHSSNRPSTEPRLIITCRQERLKGTGEVIASLPRLAGRFPGIQLDVVGDGVDLPEFRRTAVQLGVGDRVRFHGNVDHARVLGLLAEADVFVFPTRSSEGFPKAVLEALAAGLPVVTTRVSVLPQLIGRGCGVLLETATAETVAGAVEAVLADPEHWRILSRAAVETASSYSLEGWRDTIGALLRRAWGPLRREGTGRPGPSTDALAALP